MNTITLSTTQTLPVGSPIPESLRRRPTVLAPSLVAPFIANVLNAIVVTSRISNLPSLRFVLTTQDGRTIMAVQGELFEQVPQTVRVETSPVNTDKGTTIFIYTAYKA